MAVSCKRLTILISNNVARLQKAKKIQEGRVSEEIIQRAGIWQVYKISTLVKRHVLFHWESAPVPAGTAAV